MSLSTQVREALLAQCRHGTADRSDYLRRRAVYECDEECLPAAVAGAIERAASAAPSERQYERAKMAAIRVLREAGAR